MKFTRAFHKTDFDGTQQTIGLDPHGQIWLMNGKTDASEYGGRAYGQFAPVDALRFACEMLNLAVEGVRARLASGDPLSAGAAEPTAVIKVSDHCGIRPYRGDMRALRWTCADCGLNAEVLDEYLWFDCIQRG